MNVSLEKFNSRLEQKKESVTLKIHWDYPPKKQKKKIKKI